MLPPRTDLIAAPLLLKVAAGLVLALGLSLYGNYHQWRSALTAEAARAAEVRALTAEAKAAAAAAAQAYTQGFADAAADEAIRIDARLAEIADEQARLNAAYWGRLDSLPPMPANCGPGSARIDAFNAWGEP